jgi:hypothetical protein
MLHNLTNKQGNNNINRKLASGNKVNVLNTVPNNPKMGGSVVPVKVGEMRNITKKISLHYNCGRQPFKSLCNKCEELPFRKLQVSGIGETRNLFRQLTKTAMNIIKNLTKNDLLILWSGANDVAKNNTMKVFRYFVDFAKNSSHTYVILANVPMRHHLISSCVNEEFRAFNRKLIKISKIFGHVSIMEVDPNKVYYTKHGHHLNYLGKAKVSQQLSLHLLSVLQ